MAEDGSERRYLDILLGRIMTCGRYAPKLGRGGGGGGGLPHAAFQDLCRGDRFCGRLGMNSPAVYAARKPSGGLASLCRQIKSGRGGVLRGILRGGLGLPAADVRRPFKASGMDVASRTPRPDAWVYLGGIRDVAARNRFHAWMRGASASIGVGSGAAGAPRGAVFEARQGCKSRDSKRRTADMANAAMAHAQECLPCIAAPSSQTGSGILRQYREKWAVMTGADAGVLYTSTCDFVRGAVGHGLAGFFERSSEALQSEIDRVVALLYGRGDQG